MSAYVTFEREDGRPTRLIVERVVGRVDHNFYRISKQVGNAREHKTLATLSPAEFKNLARLLQEVSFDAESC